MYGWMYIHAKKLICTYIEAYLSQSTSVAGNVYLSMSTVVFGMKGYWQARRLDGAPTEHKA